MYVYVDRERCTGCGDCVAICPTGALGVFEGTAQIDRERCSDCEACVGACPNSAILTVTEPMDRGQTVPMTRPELAPSVRRGAAGVPFPAKALPWLGMALAYVGREIVPRIAASLIDAAVRRLGADNDLDPARPRGTKTADPPDGMLRILGFGLKGGHRHRFRGG
jgi:NAD-dependent dihydropyrimidine dehydrogenase PreA subunit